MRCRPYAKTKLLDPYCAVMHAYDNDRFRRQHEYACFSLPDTMGPERMRVRRIACWHVGAPYACPHFLAVWDLIL